MKRFGTLGILAALLLVPAFAFGRQALSQNEKTATIFFESIRESPPMLRGFLAQMPKGADLHTHLSGAVYAEDYLQWAMEDNLCINTANYTISPPVDKSEKPEKTDKTDKTDKSVIKPHSPCPDGTVPASTLEKDTDLYSSAINALSTRNFQASPRMWGHDQFFGTFGKFGAVKNTRNADMLATVVRRAAAQHVQYLEVMDSIYPSSLKNIATTIGWNGNATETLQAMREAGLFNSIQDSALDRQNAIKKMQAILGDEAKDITVRFIQQVNRTAPPAQVFAQIAYDFELARQAPEVVAFNLVAPEDNPVALRDYSLHMSMIDSLYAMPEYARTNITLHAGELTMGLVPPRDLRFHIREAVEKGHAKRIGHGVDVMFEDAPFSLLDTMKAKKTAVEICLSSNEQILHVSGADHPFAIYRQYGIPVLLNTDDEGVERIDLTNEYVRATITYKLEYDDVKTLSRNGLEFSFLPGESLWADPVTFEMSNACKDSLIGHETANCSKLLNESEKAQMQWKLEKDLADFERDIAENSAHH